MNSVAAGSASFTQNQADRFAVVGVNWLRSLIVLVSISVAAGSRAKGRDLTESEIYLLTLRSTVWVVSPYEDGKVSSGTGVIVDARRGLIITANHVVEKSDHATIFFPARDQNRRLITDPEPYLKRSEEIGREAVVVSRRLNSDLAMLQLQTPAGDLSTSIPIARKDARPGTHVLTVGNSGSSDGSLWRLTAGFVRQVVTQGEPQERASFLEMQLPINQGDSGGPIVNKWGELVGINHAKHTKEDLVSYGTDIREINELLSESGASVKRLMLGEYSENSIRPDGCCLHYHVVESGRVVVKEWAHVSLTRDRVWGTSALPTSR